LIWGDFRYECISTGWGGMLAWQILENNYFFGIYSRALYSFIYLGTSGDFIFRNNTLSELIYLNNPSKYFIDLHPDLNCDPAWRT
jgi:hypothetical protein